MSEDLTKKEKLAVEFVLQGDNRTEACFKAYECKDRNSAGVVANKIFKKTKVKNELTKRQAEVNKELTNKLATRTVKLVEIVERHAPRNEIAKKIAEHIMSGDKRVSLGAIDTYLKLRDEFPSQTTKVAGLFANVIAQTEQEEAKEPEASKDG